MSGNEFVLSERGKKLADAVSIDVGLICATAKGILEACEGNGIDLSKRIAVGIDVNGPMVAVDNNDLKPLAFTRECLEYLLEDEGVRASLMTGWDMSSMTHFRDHLLEVGAVGIISEYGMLYKNGEEITYLYPSDEMEALEFMSVMIDLCVEDELKFAIQGNYSTALGPVVVEADRNGGLLDHPLVKGKVVTIEDIYAVAKEGTDCELRDGRIYFENKVENLHGYFKAFAREYPLISARYRKNDNGKVSCELDRKDKEGFVYADLEKLGERISEETGRRVMVYEDFGIDAFTKTADEGDYYKQARLNAYGADVFGTDDFVEVIVGDKPNDAPRKFNETLFCSMEGTEASSYAKEVGIVHCDVGDMRDFAIALREIRMR